MKKIKKVMSVILVVCMLAAALPSELLEVRAETSADGMFEYHILDDGTIKEMCCSGVDTEVEMPAEIGVKSVNGIDLQPAKQSVNTSSAITPKLEYVITFNLNYGTLNGNNHQTTVNQRLTELPTAIRSGHTFRGWYTQSTGGDRITTNTIFVRNADVYAQWDNYEANFRDIFVSNISDTSVTITAIIPNTYIRDWGVSYGTENNYLSLAYDTNLDTSTASLSTTLTGLTPNTTYFFKVYYIADTIRIESAIGYFTTAQTGVDLANIMQELEQIKRGGFTFAGT